MADNRNTTYPSLPTFLPATDGSRTAKYAKKSYIPPSMTKKLIKRLGAVGLARQLSPLPPSAQRPIRRTTKPSSADSRSTLSLPPPSLSPPPPRESAKPPTPLKTPTVTLKPLSNRSTKKPLLIGCGCLAIILVGGVVLALIYLSKLREIEPIHS